MLRYHPIAIEYMIKERELELMRETRWYSYEKKKRRSLSDHLANFMHELGHRLEGVGSWMRRRFQPLNACGFDCPGSGCRQACS